MKLYNKTFTTLLGDLKELIEANVIEERNGMFELELTCSNADSLLNELKEGNILVCNANDTLLNQKFRIYLVRKSINNRVDVFAKHISFDLNFDYIDNISISNQSCEYVLNQIFTKSNFSKHYKGYSDIIMTSDYNIEDANVLEAIGGKRGSIIDTFGTGAEILRDNENFYVFNSRGHNNSVTIEYAKNLTGFEVEEDTSELVTRILPYAKYTNSESNEEIIVKANYVDSPLINNYSHPYILSIDYSGKFEDGEVPTVEKLIQFAQLEYSVNKKDIIKANFKIEFIPLSKCVGYESLSDKISLCDIVTIKYPKYNIDTQAKVIKATFNVLKNRYESMELGDPRTSLGDIIGGASEDKVTIEDVKDIVFSAHPNYPQKLPTTPTLTTKVYGFSTIELSWTFENEVYYSYELYASKTNNFTPNSFDLIHSGQSSSFLFQAKANETWYFKVCAINTYGQRTAFSSQATVTTTKVSDLSNYVASASIGDALIGTLSFDRGWFGQLKGNYIDAKQLSVTDGNGKRTLDIDSFGSVNLDVTNLKIKSENAVTQSQLTQTVNDFTFKFENANIPNLQQNGNPSSSNTQGWNTQGSGSWFYNYHPLNWAGLGSTNTSGEVYAFSPKIQLFHGGKYSISFFVQKEFNIESCEVYVIGSKDSNLNYDFAQTLTGRITDNDFHRVKITIDVPSDIKYLRFRIDNDKCLNVSSGYVVWFGEFMVVHGQDIYPPKWYPSSNEVYNNITTINDTGIKVSANDTSKFARINNQFIGVFDGGEADINRRIWAGLNGWGQPQIQLGVAGISPGVATFGGTHLKLLHAKPEYNPFGYGGSCGIMEYQTDLPGTPSSKIGMLQNGELIISNANEALTSIWGNMRVGRLGWNVTSGYSNTYIAPPWNGTFDGAQVKIHDVRLWSNASGGSDLWVLKANGGFTNINAKFTAQASTLSTFALSDNGIEVDEENNVASIDLGKATYNLYQENMALKEENEMLKQQQLEQDELLIENAFEIANMQLGGI